MAFEIILPKLGESIQEATITRWLVKVGDVVEDDQSLVELATEKVDSEIPSPVSGTVIEILYPENSVVPVGKVIARIAVDGEEVHISTSTTKVETTTPVVQKVEFEKAETVNINDISNRFYSPLVKNIAKQEHLSVHELESIVGTGANNRVSKKDVLNYLTNKTQAKSYETQASKTQAEPVKIKLQEGDTVVEMDRVRKLIADHMIMSKRTSAHVTNFLEVDVTNIALWREKVKDEFLKREKEKLTYLPVILEAIAKGLKDFPGVNVSVDGYNVIYRKNINLGVAVALANGNLIVPVVKNADRMNIVGLTKEINRLAEQARTGKLSPDDIQDGTFSITNFGSFKNLFGTPVINQPQVAIMAIGAFEKKPAVVETSTGDMIAIRHKCFLSLSYDHRIVDGFLGGSFLRRVADYLESFDINSKF